MTEDEAKTKWCPMTRHGYGTQGIGVNRVHQNKAPSDAVCIGSDCMMWRREKPNIDPHLPFKKMEEQNRMAEHGYCGLAGKP